MAMASKAAPMESFKLFIAISPVAKFCRVYISVEETTHAF
jgi:hypothetical protein